MGNQNAYSQIEILLTAAPPSEKRTATLRRLFQAIDKKHTGHISEEKFAPYCPDLMKFWKTQCYNYSYLQLLGDGFPAEWIEDHHLKELRNRENPSLEYWKG